jgi:hypothetical protein
LFKFTMVLDFFPGKTWKDLNSAATKAYGDWRTDKPVAARCRQTAGLLLGRGPVPSAKR